MSIDYQALYIARCRECDDLKRQLQAEHRARIAAQDAQWRDRVYAGREYAKVRAQRDTIASAYRALLATLDTKPHARRKAQPDNVEIPDFSNMTDDQRQQWFRENARVKA